MDPRESPSFSASFASRRPTAISAPNHLATKPEETFTYTLCLLGSLQHAASCASDITIKEIPLQLDSAVRQISCGFDWLCLLTENGRAYSLGSNTYGQLAQGHTHPMGVAFLRPILFPTDYRITRISCGSSHGGFLLESGALFMFGCGSYGRLGTGNQNLQASPVAVTMRWRELEASAVSERIRVPRTTIPGFARAASAPSSTVSDPVAQPDADNDVVVFVDISCGDRHTLVLGAKPSVSTYTKQTTTKNHVIAFGDGMNGRLGLGSEKDYATGMLLTQFHEASLSSPSSATPSFASVHAGTCHNAAISTTGDLYTWGHGADGQLGHGKFESEWLPRHVASFHGLSMASATCGSTHTVVVSRTGVVYAWGRGLEGQLGLGGSRVAPTATPQRVTLVVDPRAAQQAQIDAQFAAGVSSVASASSGSGSTVLDSDARVVVRSVAVRAKSVLAVDEQSRLFVWGDNTVGQLGVAKQEHAPPGGEPTHVVSPQQISYFDLREPKKPASRVRERVRGSADAMLLPRVALTHVAASDRFSVLFFRTKQPALGHGPLDGESTGCSTGTATRRLMRHRSTLLYGLDETVRWHFSLHEPLQLHDVPSRESAFYNYMTRYKVSIRHGPPSLDPHDADQPQDVDEMTKNIPSGYHGKRRSSVMALAAAERAHLQAHFRSHDNDDDNDGMREKERQPPPTCSAMKGVSEWLEKQQSPRKSPGFGATSPRFPATSRRVHTLQQDLATAPTRPQSCSVTKRRPCPPKAAFGRSAVPSSSLSSPRISNATGPNGLPRRPTTAAPRSSSIATSEKAAHQASRKTRQRLFNQFVAPFGSSVSSRFGVHSPRANDAVQWDLHPEQSDAVVLPRSPGATLGSNAEQFSQLVARRLQQAKGPAPGPGTYDRHGG